MPESNNNRTGSLSGAASASETPVAGAIPDPHVVAGASIYGTRYTRAFKLQALKEADACTEPGRDCRPEVE